MIRGLFGFVGCIICALIAIPAIKNIITQMDLASFEGVTDYELALWTLIPLGLLISVFIVSLISLISAFKRGDKDEPK